MTAATHREAVLVTSVGAKRALVRSLRHAAQRLAVPLTVVASDINPGAPAAGEADRFATMPPVDDGAFDAVLAFCQSHRIRVVVPTRDAELAFWSQHRPLFRAHGIAVVVSDPDAVAICTDKLHFFTHGVAQGWPVIPVMAAPDGAGPFVVKERFGSGSRSVGVALSAPDAHTHARRLAHPLVQPHIAGVEVSVDAWSDDRHRVKGLVLRTRDHVTNGEAVITTTFRDPALEATCTHILEALPLRGPSVLQLILSSDARPHLLEVNARFGGASTCAIAAGLDLWFWSLREALGEDMSTVPFTPLAPGIRQIRDPHGFDRIERA